MGAAAGIIPFTCISRRGSRSTGAAIAVTERLARQDVWRLRPSGRVQIQVQFGEFGAYVNHCHNTVHEDFAMLMRYQLLAPTGTHAALTLTPVPTLDGVKFLTPEVLREGDPRRLNTANRT